MQVKLAPLRFRQRPILAGAPLIGAHHPDFDRRLVEDPGVLALEPVVVPAQDLIVEGMERPLQMRRPGDEELLRHALDFLKPLLAALQMQLVSVGVPARARVKGDLDPRHFLFGLFHDVVWIVRIEHGVVDQRHGLAFFHDDVEDVRIHHQVGIAHGRAPELVGVAGELAGLAAIDVIDGAAVEQEHHRVDHAAWIEVAKSPLPVGAHRVVGEDRLQ